MRWGSSARLVGHSLGGGIAMHMLHQYPERVNRLALLATGGLGREVRPLLRVATLPGASLMLAGFTSPIWLAIVGAALLCRPDGTPGARAYARVGQPGERRQSLGLHAHAAQCPQHHRADGERCRASPKD